MTDGERTRAIGLIERAVADAHWAGLTEEEIKAVFLASLLKLRRGRL